MRDRRRIGELDSNDVDLDGLVDYIANSSTTTSPVAAPATTTEGSAA